MTFDNSSSGSVQPVQNNTNAIISLITGILGLTLIPVVGSIIAIVTGMMARKEIRAAQSGGVNIGGEGMATAGIILGWIGIGIGLLICCIVVAAIAIPAAILVPLGIEWGNSGLLLPLWMAI